jgi:hypothetical protein
VVSVEFDSYSYRRIATITHHHDIRNIQGCLAFDNAPGACGTTRLRVALNHIEPLNQHAATARDYTQDLTGFASIAARDDHHHIILSDVEFPRF